MARFIKQSNAVKIGNIGQHDVMDINGTACIVIGKTWLSVNKIKKVFENEGPCREFVEKYDKPKEQKAAASAKVTTPSGNVVSKEEFAALVQASVQAQLAKMQNSSSGRMDPMSK